jgi:hypothetical protein
VAAGIRAVIVDVARGDAGDGQDDRDVDRAELMVDDGAVADEGAEPEIPLDGAAAGRGSA